MANTRVHKTTQAVPAHRLAEEQLRPLGERPDFDTSLYTHRRVAHDASISFGGNRYSVPWRFVGRDLLVRLTPANKLQALWQGIVITSHELVQGQGQFVCKPEHYRGLEKGRPGRPKLDLVAHPVPSTNEVEQRPLSYYDEAAGVTSGA